MKYTGKWWDNPQRTKRERSVAWGVTQVLYGLLILIGLMMLASCEKQTLPTRILDGTYIVESKVWIEPNGTEKLYVPLGTDITGMNITGWMAQTKLTFQGDSINIAQLMNEGWSEGWNEVEWMNDKPIRVGCHYVQSVSDTHIAWFQDDVIIKWNLVKE